MRSEMMTTVTSLDVWKDLIADRLARVEQQLDTVNKRLGAIESRQDQTVGTTTRLVTSTARLADGVNVQQDNLARVIEILETHEESLTATAKALNKMLELQREILSAVGRFSGK